MLYVFTVFPQWTPVPFHMNHHPCAQPEIRWPRFNSRKSALDRAKARSEVFTKSGTGDAHVSTVEFPAMAFYDRFTRAQAPASGLSRRDSLDDFIQ